MPVPPFQPPRSPARPLVIVTSTLLAAVIAACGGDSTPTPAAQAQASYTADQVQQTLQVEQMRGHMLAAVASSQAGAIDQARVQAAIPIDKQLPSLAPTLRGKGQDLATKLSQGLAAQRKLLDGQVNHGQFVSAVAQSNKLLEDASAILVPPSVAGGIAFRAAVLTGLLERAVDEYAESVSGGAVTDLEPYQSGYGYYQRVNQLWGGIEDRVKARSATAYKEIEDLLDDLKTVFPAVTPPGKPVAPEQADIWSKKLSAELAAALGLSAAPKPAVAGSPADQLKELARKADQALDAIKANNVPSARTAYQDFDNGWGVIEDGVRARSRDSYRAIEEAMSDVKSVLLKEPTPDASKVITALNKLRDTIDKALPTLR